MKNNTEDLLRYLSVEEFYQQAELIIQDKHKTPNSFALVSLDFDNFNFINDLFSYEIGDKVLQRLTLNFAANLLEGEVFSRLHADHFAFLVRSAKSSSLMERFSRMTDVKGLLADILPTHYSLIASGGIVFFDDYEGNLTAFLDKANFARKQTKGNHSNTFLCYNKKMGEALEWRKAITMMMETALEEQEFEMYLQPKVLIKTGQVVGAEALVRWNSKTFGMIYPDSFIPILEQNSFIQQVDFFMLRQACLFLKNSIVNGIPPMPISINFSKMHIRTNDFVDKVFHVVNQYGISTNLIEIEFTENIYLDDFQELIEITSALKYLGFKVSLDDFGSAYSSLNYLKDLPLDIIKIDKGFLNSSENTDKGRIIISKIVELIKSLRLVSVMEGVETEEQSAFLQKLSCDFGQGYFYAKPMPAVSYIDFVKSNSAGLDMGEYFAKQIKNVDKSYLHVIPQEFQMDNWELYTLGQNIDMGLMKGYLDGEATVQYVNDRALEYLGYTRQEFREIFDNSIVAFTHPDDAYIVQANADQLIKSGEPLQFQTRAIRKDGKIIVLQGRSSCVMDSCGRPVGIYAFQDVTEELERTQALEKSLNDKITELETLVNSQQESREALRMSEECYRLIVEQCDSIMFEWNFLTDVITFSEKFVEMFRRNAIQKDVSSNPAIRETVYLHDLPIFEQWIKNTYQKVGVSQADFRLLVGDGSYLWIRSHSTSIQDNAGKPIKAVGVFTNMEKRK